MYRLSSIGNECILLIATWCICLPQIAHAQSPHGESLGKMDCVVCHNPDGWEIAMDTFRYDHGTTFPLEGRHLSVDCRACHSSLVFSEAPMQCVDCHEDMHSASVGNDCTRCHDTDNWLVDDTPEIHEKNGFPLVGVHDNLSCIDCHRSETGLRFDRLGNDCINCHSDDYQSTQSPNHTDVGYSADNCTNCHDPFSTGWTAGEINHNFFPLTQGHNIQDCQQCHLTDKYSDASPECISCHEDNFNNTNNPAHVAGGFPTDCTLCHTTEPGWAATAFGDHDDQYFPIYSGKHKGEWNQCTDCHTNSGDFSSFSCIDCHEHSNQAGLTREHNEVSGFDYESNACYQCHPKGEE